MEILPLKAHYPGVYTRVSTYTQWIKKTIIETSPIDIPHRSHLIIPPRMKDKKPKKNRLVINELARNKGRKTNLLKTTTSTTTTMSTTSSTTTASETTTTLTTTTTKKSTMTTTTTTTTTTTITLTTTTTSTLTKATEDTVQNTEESSITTQTLFSTSTRAPFDNLFEQNKGEQDEGQV